MEKWILTADELNDMMDDDFVERARGLGPISWESYAKSLKYAADIIIERYRSAVVESSHNFGGRMDVPAEEPYERDLRLISTYYLLMGLSIENLAKGIVMIRHPEYLKNNTELDKDLIGTHNTNWLLRNNNIYGFEDDADILNALEKCVLWMSKYPVSIKREKFDWGCDWLNPEAVDKLYNKLYEVMDEEKEK